MKLNCAIIDDSSIQRIIIVKLVKNNINLNLVDDFSNALDAKKFLLSNPIDLLFLDVEMPILNGFDFLDGLEHKPQIIFITSKADYALKAFDYDATDYLKKPLTKERFDAAITRALNNHILRSETQDENAEHIFIKSKLKKLKIYTSKIKWVESSGDYINLVTEDAMHPILTTMKSFEDELPKERFVRVHKSFIVNIEKVDRFNSKFAEIGSMKIPLSRDKKDNLKNALEAN
jgi:two-component system, LytTR family, response regulator